MANEFKLTTQLTYANGQLKHTYQPGTLQLPQATQGFDSKVVTINTSAEENVTFDLTTEGLCYMQSLEATTTGSYVSWGALSSTGGLGTPICRLYPKEVHVLHFNPNATLRMQAVGAAVNVLFFVGEQ